MPMFDSGFKVAARTSGRELAEVAGVSCSRLQPIVSEVQLSERFADRAFRATWAVSTDKHSPIVGHPGGRQR